jgi:hypothetical protein
VGLNGNLLLKNENGYKNNSSKGLDIYDYIFSLKSVFKI